MALTGFMHDLTCYADVSTALRAHFSELMPVTLSTGELITFEYYPSLLAWERVSTTYKITGGVTSPTVTFSTASLPTLTSCDPVAGFNDGILFSMLLVALVFGASMWGILARAR